MKHILKQFAQREAHPIIQFVKYGIGGGIATAVHIGLFSFLAWKVFPALKEDELVVRLFNLAVPALDESRRTFNYGICSVIAFLFSNFTAYLINVYWVFHPGRHSRHKEIMYFYVVSITSFAIGTLLAMGLIRLLNLATAVAFVANMVASVLINYAGRKYFVFKG